MERTEGVKPDCMKQADGCLIPPLPMEAERVMAIRSDIRSLRGLVEAGPILAHHGAGLEDIRLLALVENELRAAVSQSDLHMTTDDDK